MRKTVLLLSVASIAIATPAFAQDAAQTPETAEATTPNATYGDENLGDIIVTATRRSERLSDVPIAVSAVGQAALQNSGATDIRQLAQLAPSLQVSSTGSEANASARIRGIGTVGDNPGLESSVATFIDGVYRSRTGAGMNDIGEVDRIEVLRGPQGTLSGRNASAGSISIITKQPEFNFGGYGEATYGNYNNIRVAGALTGPLIADTVAFRVDGVYGKRDGFYHDVVNNTDYNDRNRYFVRGQLLIEPSSDLKIRLIGDFTRRNEKCCGAVYLDTNEKIVPPGGAPGSWINNPAGSRIVDVMQSMGAVFPNGGTAYRNDPYKRQIANSPGKAYSNVTKDYGGSAQVDWNLGGASLTSITAYREYKSDGASDIDYGSLDIGSRPDNGNNYRRFRTFTQELRLNGEAFDGKLNWLIGGYYSREKLQVVDNLQFGSQYGAFAACRAVATLNPTAALRNPNAPGCLSTALVAPGVTARAAFAGGLLAIDPSGRTATTALRGLDNLSTLNNLGSIRDVYNQDSENYAFFTHNIFKLTDTLSLTGGLRYTHERKNFNANFQNNNTVCTTQFSPTNGVSSLLAPDPTLSAAQNAQRAQLAANLLTLSCTGNSSAALNGKSISDDLKEGQFTGTAVLSWKPTNNLMTYASYSRGYKAGGYNLDRSELGLAYLPTTTANPNASLLRFDPETVNAFEVGFKYSSRQFTLNVAGFRQQFSNFQLNTFNGTNYVVQNIGSCSTSLNGGDRDQSATTGACGSKVNYGVLSQGVEVEAGIYPARNFAVNLGYTFADTKYRNNLVGSKAGAPLDPALFMLPGNQMSNAPRNVVTMSTSWTPEIGSNGMTALFYVDGRLTSDYNTGSDLYVEKAQDGFFLMNARIGLRGDKERWALEFWGQNLLNTQYTQVTFNAPFQGSGSIDSVKAFGGVGNQIFSSFLSEPRTYGVTLRTRF